jgi:hypothetical protein
VLIRITFLSAAALVVILGWYQLFTFSSTPGEQFAAPSRWPPDIPIPRASAIALHDSSIPLLLVFIHPRCSCTPATLEQLNQLLDSTHAAVRTVLVVYRSNAVDPAISETSNRATASAAGQPGIRSAIEPIKSLRAQAQIVLDTDGVLARRFGAATSGEIVLYSAGRLLFQGGITPMRAQVGESAGADALRIALTNGAAQARIFSVFGCPIYLPGHAG